MSEEFTNTGRTKATGADTYFKIACGSTVRQKHGWLNDLSAMVYSVIVVPALGSGQPCLLPPVWLAASPVDGRGPIATAIAVISTAYNDQPGIGQQISTHWAQLF